jgi:hypothetical protein
VLPAPAGVPVDRRVGIGLVRPFTVRPARGVWARVRSRPVFARLFAPRFDEAGLVAFLAFDDVLGACVRAALRLEVRAPAVRRPVFRPARAFLPWTFWRARFLAM